MNKELLKQIINQIKKYSLTKEFENVREFQKWICDLSETQMNNFLSLSIDFEEIEPMKNLLINRDLLSCDDYVKRVEAISRVKNGEGCWHLFGELCKPCFLHSKKFYQDIELLSKADTARYVLWVIGEKSFVDSPYHDKDLKMIIEANDTEDEGLDFVVADALATVAKNAESIKSGYHEKDMELIASSGSKCLQMSNTYPQRSINNLACDSESLKDSYHLENMRILSDSTIASVYLYSIMTNPLTIKGKTYREEVEALASAKNKTTAKALYYYIVNSKAEFGNDYNMLRNYEWNINDSIIDRRNTSVGIVDPDYSKNLRDINDIAEEFVMHYVSLLVNLNFLKSPNKRFDLELLKTITSKPIFMDLYYLMSNEDFLRSVHHKMDSVVISKTESNNNRYMLRDKAVEPNSERNPNHEYDMCFISQFDFDSINDETYGLLYHYLFNPDVKDSSEHMVILEKIKQGKPIDERDELTEYFDDLESIIENENSIIHLNESSESKKESKIRNTKSRVLSFLKRKNK